jgi:hypothetical protein
MKLLKLLNNGGRRGGNAANIAKLLELLRKVLSAARACVYSITLSARATNVAGIAWKGGHAAETIGPPRLLR